MALHDSIWEKAWWSMGRVAMIKLDTESTIRHQAWYEPGYEIHTGRRVREVWSWCKGSTMSQALRGKTIKIWQMLTLPAPMWIPCSVSPGIFIRGDIRIRLLARLNESDDLPLWLKKSLAFQPAYIKLFFFFAMLEKKKKREYYQ